MALPTPARLASFDGKQPTNMVEGVDRPCRTRVVIQTDCSRKFRMKPERFLVHEKD
jgi:hypothetical protein